jgi:hypothetical protein
MQRVFQLVRIEDVSGVAGTGVVASGYVAKNGKACLFWLVPGKPQTVVVADCFEDLCIHLHDGRTVVQWLWAEGEPPC